MMDAIRERERQEALSPEKKEIEKKERLKKIKESRKKSISIIRVIERISMTFIKHIPRTMKMSNEKENSLTVTVIKLFL